MRGKVLAGQDDVSGRRVGPMAILVEAGKSADGTEDGGGSDGNVVDFLDELFDGDADVLAAGNVESGGTGMAIDGVNAGDLEGFANPVGAGPVDEEVFDHVGVVALADLAPAAVTLEARNGFAAVFQQGAGCGAGGASVFDFLRICGGRLRKEARGCHMAVVVGASIG